MGAQRSAKMSVEWVLLTCNPLCRPALAMLLGLTVLVLLLIHRLYRGLLCRDGRRSRSVSTQTKVYFGNSQRHALRQMCHEVRTAGESSSPRLCMSQGHWVPYTSILGSGWSMKSASSEKVSLQDAQYALTAVPAVLLSMLRIPICRLGCYSRAAIACRQKASQRTFQEQCCPI